MSNQMRVLMFGFMGMAAVGCASARLEVLRPLATPERRVALRLEGAPESKLSESERARYQSLLTSRLAEKGITVVAGQADTQTAKGNVTKYDRGNRALRYLIGFGAGRGTLTMPVQPGRADLGRSTPA